jgi:4-hydroxy-tetrahydrodipicolinate reductase
MSTRLLLVGHGRMGRLVESLAGATGFDVVGAIDSRSQAGTWPDSKVPVVIGTTGWQDAEAGVRATAARAGLGVVAAPNFAIGVNIFLATAERIAGLMASQPEFGAWIDELHHAAKRDAPSGTALALASRVRRGGFERPVPIASTRAGSIPGTHTLGFDAASETITLTHAARDRAAFARGALLAARWVIGRTGWYSMSDVLGL